MRMKYFNIKNKDYLKSVSALVSGSVLANLITFAVSPLLTRLYSADDFGGFYYIISIVSIFSTIINGRYDVSLVTSTKKDLYPLMQLSFFICLVASLIVSLGCGIFGALSTKVTFTLWDLIYIFLLLVIAGIVNVLNSLNNRLRDFNVMTKVYVIRSFFQNLLMIVLGLMGSKVSGLLFSQFLGQVWGLKLQAKSVNTAKLFTFSRIVWIRIYNVAKKYKEQFFLSAPATFVNALSYSFISLIIGSEYGLYILGLYSISVRVLGLPLNVFSSNLAKVHYSDAYAEIEKNGNFYVSTKKTLKLGLVIILPIFLILLFFAPIITKIIFGTEWKEAGVYIQIFCFMFAFRFLIGSLGFSFILSNSQKLEFYFQVLLLITMFLCAIIAHAFNFSILMFLSGISALYSIIYMIELLVILKKSKLQLR